MAAERFDWALRLTVLMGGILALGSACVEDANAPSDASLGADARTYDGQCDDLWSGGPFAVVKVGDQTASGDVIRSSDYDHVHRMCRDAVGCTPVGTIPCGGGDRIVCEACFGQRCILAYFQSECSIGSDD